CDVRFFKEQTASFAAPVASQPAYLREFAHIAAIGWTQPNGNVVWGCGGSLVWENFILTAAHCSADDNDVPPDVARMGDINIYSDEDDEFAQELKIVDIVRHPKHRFGRKYYDIALMKLERNVSVHETVAPTCLWVDDEIRFPKLLAAGWGAIGIGEKHTETLMKVEVAPVSNAECSRYHVAGELGLKQGLQDDQMCAVDKEMDTCPGDSGGPLHVKLFKDKKMIPFLVGVTSFGKACGLSVPSVYVKVSKFVDWIVETLQQHGELATRFKFEPLVCTDRYYYLREYKEDIGKVINGIEYIDLSILYVSLRMSDFIVDFRWKDTSFMRPDCFGTLIEPNIVVTLAQCVMDRRTNPTQVVLNSSRAIDIVDIIVHPAYKPSTDPYYNNIAVVKLESYAYIEPYCVWYGNHNPGMNVLLTGKRLIPEEHTTIPHHITIMTRGNERTSEQCHLAQRYISALREGLKEEHLCFENQPFIVPESCELKLGGPIERKYGKVFIDGINLFGRDCGYGEPAVGVRLSAHKAWLESVLLPQPLNTVLYIDSDLFAGDKCRYADGTAGLCVPQTQCSNIHERIRTQKQIIFCKTGSVVCCPQTPTNLQTIEREFNECEQRYLHLRTKEYDFKAHVVEIGWKNNVNTATNCLGYLISTRGVVTSASCLRAMSVSQKIVKLGGDQFIGIEAVKFHPKYSQTTNWHNVAVVKLVSAVQPSVTAFPGCLWMNVTHSPVLQFILNVDSAKYDPIHPMYKSDCEGLLKLSFDESETICMNPDHPLQQKKIL
uniref:Peptidase S1 domain-containing protein n=1 Tax=Anopheles dirus TaxID=7168 RepID=A0A182N933_9DIPT